jgi:hypothetical protein
MAIYGLNFGLDHLDGFIRVHLLNKLEFQWGRMVQKGFNVSLGEAIPLGKRLTIIVSSTIY